MYLSFSSCSLLSVIGLTGRPFGILRSLQFAYTDCNTNVTDLSFITLVSCTRNCIRKNPDLLVFQQVMYDRFFLVTSRSAAFRAIAHQFIRSAMLDSLANNPST